VIIGSLLLILVAVTLLVVGLANGSSVLLISSIAASLLAAVALVVGARQAAAARAEAGFADDDERERAGAEEDERELKALTAGPATESLARRAGPAHGQAPHQSDGTVFFGSPVAVAEPEVGHPTGHPLDPAADVAEAELLDGDDPPDEPAEQYVSPADAARVAQMTADVLVIDGRPRYHLDGCVHLLGRDSEPLPVSEAVELGFSPCGRCEPDSALLAG
jgi:hypothetical protein